MAETLTVDPNPPAEIVGESEGVQLTAEEQDSLNVGSKLQEEQGKLLAGKYKNAEELERAYGELQKKIIKIAKQLTKLRFQKPMKYQKKRKKLQTLLKEHKL